MIMKKTVTVLLAALLALTPITMTSCEMEFQYVVTTTATTTDTTTTVIIPVKDLLKNFVPQEAYEAASRKFSEADNYEVYYTRDIKIGVGAPTTKAMSHYVSEKHDGDDLYLETSVKGINTQLTYVDGKMYRLEKDEGETKTKATVTADEFGKFFPRERPTVIETRSDSQYASATALQIGNTVLLTFPVTVEEMAVMAGDLTEFVEMGVEAISIQFTRGTYSVCFNEEGDIIETRGDFYMTYVAGNITYDGNICIKSVIAYDSAEVNAPANANTYIDITGKLEIPE